MEKLWTQIMEKLWTQIMEKIGDTDNGEPGGHT